MKPASRWQGLSFPEDFLWGTATASYQIEGAVHEDGRGESIWDRFSHTRGKVYGNHNGDTACDHYHRYREDVRLMREIGLKSYRFSIAWPRVFPKGGGRLNPAGVDFYQRLTDELLAAGIVPMATLYHWDLPQALQERGGWQSRDTVKYFGDYAAALFERLADRLKLWITLNEPWVSAFAGHWTGEHAPGLKDKRAAVQVSHHLLLAHALAVRRFRERGDAGGKIGITLNLAPADPVSDRPEDLQAAAYYDAFQNRWFLDPVFKARYPEDMLQWYGERGLAPEVLPEDLDQLQAAAAGLDFLGVNFYMRQLVGRPQSEEAPFATVEPDYEGVRFTEMGWEVYPEALHALLLRLQQDYDPPELYVTENGAAFKDRPDAEGRFQDEQRIAYLEEHFAAAGRALQEGVRLKGYQVWSLIDNFEWAHGYSKRFGIVHVDYRTQKRTPKQSAGWYSEVIANRGL